MENVTGVLIAGGLGTRLRPAVSDRPKALGEVGGRAFVTYLLDQLQEAGFGRVVLCTGYKGDMVEAFLGDRYDCLDLFYSRELKPLGTGGALRYARDHFNTPVILVMNGDSFIDISLSEVLHRHFSSKASISMVVAHRQDASRFGSVQVSDGNVVGFREKDRQAGGGLINAGIYVLDTELLALIPAGTVYSLEKEFFPGMAEKGKISAFKAEGDFIDIGTPKSFFQAESFFRNKMNL